MNRIVIAFIIIIIIALLYLITVNSTENKNLENFQNTLNSMATYYQDSTDSDSLWKIKHNSNNLLTTPNLIERKSRWNGYWDYFDNNVHYYACFLQVNKNILFSLSKQSFSVWTNTNTDTSYNVDPNNAQCLPDMFIGRGELNQNEDVFYLKQVYCTNGNTNPQTPFIFNSEPLDDNSMLTFTGINEFNKIILKNNTGKITLTKNVSSPLTFDASAEYLLKTSYNRPINQIKNSITFDSDVCKNSFFGSNSKNQKGAMRKCYITDGGLPTPDEPSALIGGKNFEDNQYGTGCANQNDIIMSESEEEFPMCPTNVNDTCFIPITSDDGNLLSKVNNYSKCDTTFDMSVQNQSSLTYPYYLKSGSQLNLCNIFEPFYSGNNINSVIVMYIDNLVNVKTLSYDFFGTNKGQSYLTTQLDLMFPYMNNNFLKGYRENITETSLQLTNCLQTGQANNVNGVSNFGSLVNSCKSKYESAVGQYESLMNNLKSNKQNTENNMLQQIYNNGMNIETIVSSRTNQVNQLTNPTVWNMNFDQPVDYTNSCSFSLSTSQFYEKESQFVKYADFDSMKNKTSMSLFKGSNKQKLVLENPYVIDSLASRNLQPTTKNGISNNFVLMSGNLRTYNPKKYLIPGQGIPNHNFGTELFMQDKVNPNGKWLLLGMNLTNNLNNGTSSNLHNKTLVKTLRAIRNAISI